MGLLISRELRQVDLIFLLCYKRVLYMILPPPPPGRVRAHAAGDPIFCFEPLQCNVLNWNLIYRPQKIEAYVSELEGSFIFVVPISLPKNKKPMNSAEKWKIIFSTCKTIVFLRFALVI